MTKQWGKRGDNNNPYLYLQNGMYLRLSNLVGNEWDASLMLKADNTSHEIMAWEFDASSIEGAKDLAYSKLKLWLQELAERV